jgi:Ser-tRNA(Ala) deacylase AlaX
MESTTLAYLDNQYTYTGSVTLLGFHTHEDGRTSLVLDKTLFYPQGGGQPADNGAITGSNGTFTVKDVRFLDGIVYHYGALAGTFTPGESVQLTIDQPRRHLNSRLHTAGHLIDEAVKALGFNWQATKGIHFPGQAAVEYTGELTTPVEEVSKSLESQLNKMILIGSETRVFFAQKEKLEHLCHFVLPNLPENKPTRVAVIWGEKGIPCGGTHVANISEIGPATIRKIKASKGNIKVSYELAESNA